MRVRHSRKRNLPAGIKPFDPFPPAHELFQQFYLSSQVEYQINSLLLAHILGLIACVFP